MMTTRAAVSSFSDLFKTTPTASDANGDQQERRRVAFLSGVRQRRRDALHALRVQLIGTDQEEEAIDEEDTTTDGDPIVETADIQLNGNEDMETTGTDESKRKQKKKRTSENVDMSSSRRAASTRPRPHFASHLMMGEWLLARPHDLTANWFCVACPVGRRCLLVARHGVTRAFRTKSGRPLVHPFVSSLPGGGGGGHRLTTGHPQTANAVLDCVYHSRRRTFFVLDLLCWNSHWVADSEAEFRFYLLTSKFREEIPEADLEEIGGGRRYRFMISPGHDGIISSAEAVLELCTTTFGDADGMTSLDGLLFYHRRGHYTAGLTPLVGWLKPDMVHGVLLAGETATVASAAALSEMIPVDRPNDDEEEEELEQVDDLNEVTMEGDNGNDNC